LQESQLSTLYHVQVSSHLKYNTHQSLICQTQITEICQEIQKCPLLIDNIDVYLIYCHSDKNTNQIVCDFTMTVVVRKALVLIIQMANNLLMRNHR
ncbi:unnamed protein product, partial [Brassica rapa]